MSNTDSNDGNGVNASDLNLYEEKHSVLMGDNCPESQRDGLTGLDNLSFYQKQNNERLSLLHGPIAPPPATAPPNPPHSGESKFGATNAGRNFEKSTSFQKEQYDLPQITSYQENDDFNQYDYGEIGIRTPNTGGRNNNALPMLVKRMRTINIILSTLSFLFEIPLIVFKLFNPARLVLAAYLGFMAFLLLGFELHTPIVTDFLIDNFGILYTPTGRSFFIILMGLLAFGQGSALQYLLGIALFLNGCFTLVVNCIYSEFKSVHESPDQREDMLKKATEYGMKKQWVDGNVFTDKGKSIIHSVGAGYGSLKNTTV